MCKALNYAKKFDALIKEMEKEAKSINSNLSTIDLEKSDIEHLIEINSLSVDEMLNIFAQLKDVLIKRRGIKKEFTAMQTLIDVLKVSSEDTTELIRAINNTNRRLATSQYKPRIRTDLPFENKLEGV